MNKLVCYLKLFEIMALLNFNIISFINIGLHQMAREKELYFSRRNHSLYLVKVRFFLILVHKLPFELLM